MKWPKLVSQIIRVQKNPLRLFNEATSRTLLEALCDNGHLEEAVQLLGKVLRKGMKTPKQRLQGFTLTRFLEIANVEGIKGFSPSVSMYEAKLEALCRERRTDAAVQVIGEEMLDDNCVPTATTYKIMVKGLCDEGKSMAGIRYLDNNGESRFVEVCKVFENMLGHRYWPSAAALSIGSLEGCVPRVGVMNLVVVGRDGKL
ncbi:hypothetical protein IFM89_039698, partial [Coptis chinensis]